MYKNTKVFEEQSQIYMTTEEKRGVTGKKTMKLNSIKQKFKETYLLLSSKQCEKKRPNNTKVSVQQTLPNCL
jgi:hypothetical protein